MLEIEIDFDKPLPKNYLCSASISRSGFLTGWIKTLAHWHAVGDVQLAHLVFI